MSVSVICIRSRNCFCRGDISERDCVTVVAVDGWEEMLSEGHIRLRISENEWVSRVTAGGRPQHCWVFLEQFLLFVQLLVCFYV